MMSGCDQDGGIVVPAGRVRTVLEEAERLTRKETLIREEPVNGLSLQQALDNTVTSDAPPS